jgi:hypothetical protein
LKWFSVIHRAVQEIRFKEEGEQLGFEWSGTDGISYSVKSVPDLAGASGTTACGLTTMDQDQFQAT